MRELYSKHVKESENELFKLLYYITLRAPIPEVGKLIHVLKDKFTPVERDILFSTYEKRKMAKEVTQEDQNGKTEESSNIEEF